MASISALGIGSGLDLSGLLDQLAAAERQQLAPIRQQQATHEAKISSFSRIQGALEAFQSATSELVDRNLYSKLKAELVSGESVSLVTRGAPVAGRYEISVHQLAREYHVATVGVADAEANLGAATLRIVQQNGEEVVIELEEDASSLEQIRDAINDADGGVSASLVNDGGAQPYRLVLSSRETGTDHAIVSVDFGALSSTLNLDAATEVAAQNASFSVNNIEIQSQSNVVEGAIQGLTVTLLEAGDSVIRVQADRDAARDAISAWVERYNNLASVIDSVAGFDAEKEEAGLLLGDSTVRMVESRLRDALTGRVAGGRFRYLSDIGIRHEVDGKLSIDEERLDEALTLHPEEIAELLSGSDDANGLLAETERVLTRALEDNGLIDGAIRGLKVGIEGLEARYRSRELAISRTIERYRVQFAELDSLISRMNSTSDYLMQQFAIMNAQLGRD